MSGSDFQHYRQSFKYDAPAGLVVFLVALPLCLGIALASGAPLFSGLIAGLIGGIIVSWASGSPLSVSGPAAGLTVIVFNAIEQLGSFQGFLLAVTLAGCLQLLFGYLRAGIIAAFFPSAVIKGMLAAIGLILIIKQFPHAVGYHANFDGDESYMNETAAASMQELWFSLGAISWSSTIISAVALLILIGWESPKIKKLPVLGIMPGALVAVIWGIAYNEITAIIAPAWTLSGAHLVLLPITNQLSDFVGLLQSPDWSFLSNPAVYKIALTLAVIASLETLLSLEAVDKLDPLKRIAPTNRELKAQGLGNILSGLLGGLPITAVIVRSSANINAGGRTRVACFVHGVLLLLSVLFFARWLNHIPLACLSAILLQTGYKLAKPTFFIEAYRQGINQFIAFAGTIAAILVTDLLQGIAIGMVIGLFFVIRAHYHTAITLHREHGYYTLLLNKDVSFLNKALLRQLLNQVEPDSQLLIDASRAHFIDHDIMETIEDFLKAATDKNIAVELRQVHGKDTSAAAYLRTKVHHDSTVRLT